MAINTEYLTAFLKKLPAQELVIYRVRIGWILYQ